MVGPHFFLHMLDTCRVNAFYHVPTQLPKRNSGPMEEDPPRLLDQKEFHLSQIERKTICCPLAHGSVNVVKGGLLKKGRCHQCALGPNKRPRVETRFGCVECQVHLCPGNCHDIYHARLAMGNP